MCDFFSCIVMKNKRVIWEPGVNGHHILVERHKIPDNTHDPAKMKFARVEILPPTENYVFEKNLAKWNFRVDEKIRPEWFSPAHQEAAMVALSDCLSQCVIDGGEFEKIEGKSGLYLRNTTIKVLDSSTVQEMWDSSTVQEMLGSSTVQKMLGRSTVQEMWGSSTVQKMLDSSTVQKMWDSSTVQDMLDSSTVQVYSPGATFKINGELAVAVSRVDGKLNIYTKGE